MKIVIIGSGNVATHLGLALAEAQETVVQVYSRSISNATLLADKLSCRATDSVADIVGDADAYVFSVKDDVLPELAGSVRSTNPDAVFMHTAGSVPMDVFAGNARHYGVLYPMQTFSKQREVNFREVPCFVEADSPETLAQIRALACRLSGNVRELSLEKRKSLHLAAVFACNFTNHCYHLAERILSDAGIDFSVMLPLIDCTAAKVHTTSPGEAQTGPAVRNDETIINRHLSLMDDDMMRQIYTLMSQSIHKAAQ